MFTKPTFKLKQKSLFGRLKKLRANPTAAEVVLRYALKKNKIKSIFQKGFIQGDYYCIVDFYLPRPNRIVIEVDGGYHLTKEQKLKDRRKDNYLKQRDFIILRFTNDDVLGRLALVLDLIEQTINIRHILRKENIWTITKNI